MTVLVVADATVMTAQDDLASSAQYSHLESREHLLYLSLAGSLSLDLLSQAQAYLSANPADCGSLGLYLASVSASSSARGEDSGIGYSANATVLGLQSAPPPEADNLTLLSPFSGYLVGALNVEAALSVEELGGGGSVSLERTETHVLNLPIAVDSASSLCASALSSLASALSSSPCNATVEQEAFAYVLPGLVQQAAALGFTLTAGWGSAGCSAAYWVTLVEPGVAGPAGSFDWTVRGSGSTG